MDSRRKALRHRARNWQRREGKNIDLSSEINLAFEELEKEGRIVKTGEYRRNRQGILEPVYAAREISDQDEQPIREARESVEVDCPRPRSEYKQLGGK